MRGSLAAWLTRLEKQHPKSIDLGLERVTAVYDRLGSARPARQVISVAGTNGKGSTVAYIDAMARAAGWRCGRYTSPHLVKFNERIVIQGEPVSDRSLCAVFEEIELAMDAVSLTYFEFTTLAALLIFSRSTLDVVVLEVGLGGRLDAVNIIDPDVAVITSIGIDHEDWLGDNRELIGLEKAGIMRPGIPVICTERDLPESIERHASDLGANLQRIGVQYDLPEFVPAMAGPAQRDNLASALAALKALPNPPQSLTGKIVAAAASITISGRFEKLQSCPDVFIDVAHNVQAAEQLAISIDQLPCDGTRWFIMAMLNDKQVELVAETLDGLAGHWHLAGLEGPRGMSSQKLHARLEGRLAAPVKTCDSISMAIKEVMSQADEQDQVIIFGSFLTVAEAIHNWKR